MSLKDLDYRENNNNYESPLKNDTLGKFIITEIVFPYTYLSQVKEINKERRTEAEYLEEDYTELIPTFKEGGLAIRCALISYKDGDIWNKTVSQDDMGKYVLNNSFNIFTEVDMLPIDKILNVTTSNGAKFGDVYRLGGDDTFNADGTPKTYNMFPSVKTSRELIELRSRNKTLTDEERNKIKEEYIGRMQVWERLVKSWKELTDDEVETFLKNRLSKRLMLWDPDTQGKKVKYVPVQPGIIFQGKIRKQENSNYFRIVVLEWSKAGNKWTVNNYGDKITKPNNDTLQMAKDLNALDYNK